MARSCRPAPPLSRVRTTWDGLVGFFRALPGRVSGLFGGMFGGIGNVQGALNWVIDKWNGSASPCRPSTLGPLGKVGGWTVSTPNIPRLAQGGIVTGPDPSHRRRQHLTSRSGRSPRAPGPASGSGGGGNTQHHRERTAREPPRRRPPSSRRSPRTSGKSAPDGGGAPGVVVAFQPIVELGLAATSAGVFVLTPHPRRCGRLAGGDGFVWTDDRRRGRLRSAASEDHSRAASRPCAGDGGSISFGARQPRRPLRPANTSGPFYPQFRQASR